jgi:hypothetical protein
MRADIPELKADRRADRRTVALVAALAAVSLVVTAVTRQTEAVRVGSTESWSEIWLLEATSHIVIVGLAAMFPLLLDRAPLTWGRFGRAAPIIVAAYLTFTVLHVSLMHVLRALLFPVLIGQGYAWRAFDVQTLGYEGLKDLFAFLLLGCGFLLNRSIESSRLEQRERLSTAEAERKIVLHAGGTTHVVAAADIVWAKAAGNYAEIHTSARSLFVRITFANLEQILAAAGQRHVRIHRSYIVNLDRVASIQPTGEGDVLVKLATGEELPGSRRYRDNLDAIGTN